MRVTPTIQNRIFLENLVQTKTRLDKSQAEIATGKRVNELVDDPYAAARASDISAVSTVNEEFVSNNDHLKGKLEFVDTALQQMIRAIDEARVLAARALSGTTDPQSRAALAIGVDGVKKEILSTSNAQYDGVFLFSGTQRPAGAAFTDTGATITYDGNDEAIYQRLDRTTTIQTNITGQQLFMNSPNVFTTLDNLKTAIQNDQVSNIQAELANLESLSDRLNTVSAINGTRMNEIDGVQSRLKDQNLALQKDSSRLTDANLVESISTYNLANQAVNVSLSSQAKIQQLSLIDYLR